MVLSTVFLCPFLRNRKEWCYMKDNRSVSLIDIKISGKHIKIKLEELDE